MDQDGNLIVVDQLNPGLPASVTQLKKFTATGTFIQLIGSGWGEPFNTAFDSNNNLYVADVGTDTVSVFTPN